MDSGSSTVKPPNILVYVGEKQERAFKNIAASLLRCLNTDKYVVYELKKTQVLGTPWKDNVALLVVFSEEIGPDIAEAFRDYIRRAGKVMICCSNFNHEEAGLKCNATSGCDLIRINYKTTLDVPVWRGKYSYSSDKCEILATDGSGEPILLKSTYCRGSLIASAAHLALDPSFFISDKTESVKQSEENRLQVLKSILSEELGLEVVSVSVPKPTPGYTITDDKTSLSEFRKRMNLSEISIGKVDQSCEELDVSSDIKVPLLFESDAQSAIAFEKQAYFSKLKTNLFGRVAVYFPVITSTMIAAERLSQHEGIAVIAGRQVSGRGRSGNVWISPEGCAMFTLHHALSLSSFLGQRMSVLQHMASLAVVHGIRKNPEYDKLELRLKWPNDIYYENDKKIGGVLVNTTIQGSSVHSFIGVGVNVSNERPTVCINSAIEAHNSSTGDTMPLLKMEEVIAFALTELESLIDDFTKSGPDNFLSLYYSYWLHKDQRVSLYSEGKEATIQGLDDYGFLIVQTDELKQLTLQPDGNRFDMMKNLIIAKE